MLRAETLRNPIFIVGCLILPLVIYVSNVLNIAKWNEARGVFDDLCYLRQAKLFQQRGLIEGLDTSIRYEPALYLVTKYRAVGNPENTGILYPPCHSFQERTGKIVLQYPPGTGFLLSLFPEGAQARFLYIAATTAVLLIVIFSILLSPTTWAAASVTAFGSLMLYFMINPSKASYSIAPSVPLCMLLGLLAVQMITAKSPWRAIAAGAAAGLAIGALTSIRIASVLLLPGLLFGSVYLLLFERQRRAILQLGALVLGFLVTALPVVVANQINCGRVFATAYRGADIAIPDFSLSLMSKQIIWYLSGNQGLLNGLAIASIGLIVLLGFRYSLKYSILMAFLIGLTFLLNFTFFITHPIQSQYYMVPTAVFALWATIYFLFFANKIDFIWQNRPIYYPASLRAILTFGLAVIVSALLIYLIPALGRYWQPPRVSFPIDPKAVIWAYRSGGFFTNFADRYAATGMGKAPPASRSFMLKSIFGDGRTQWIVMDHENMDVVLQEAYRIGPVSFIGNVFGHRVYELKQAQKKQGGDSS